MRHIGCMEVELHSPRSYYRRATVPYVLVTPQSCKHRASFTDVRRSRIVRVISVTTQFSRVAFTWHSCTLHGVVTLVACDGSIACIPALSSKST